MSSEIIPYRGLLIILQAYDGYTATVSDQTGEQVFTLSGASRDVTLRNAKAMIDQNLEGPRRV